MKTLALLLAFATTLLTARAADASVSGELRKWHKVTLSFNGPSTSETATPNPFTDYRLNVTFSHAGSGKSYLVPGYYAADGDAANTSATSGNVWRVHFAPDEIGTWTYHVSFRSGSNVAMDASATAGSSAGFFDGDSGSFFIAATDKTGRDFRGKGRLEYVGKHHLRFAETGEYFMKAGVDAPENLLAYKDFDGEFKTDGREDDLLKDWQPHVADWNPGDPVWQGTKGKGLIGAINYLASEGLNAFSFLTMNIEGDDKNVYPYTTYSERLRMDVSKLDQWEVIFEHGTKNGMHMNFKTQETENELMLDGGNTGNQRKLYYRELIARFGHNLGLNWNMGEEINAASLQQKQAWAQYFCDNDPYHHPIVIHNGATHYNMMGDASKLTGFSLQLNAEDFTDCFEMTKDYLDRSDAAGKPWVVACDEPGDSRYSLRPDDDPGTSHTNARKDALWGNVMAGGAGLEFYFGYALHDSDLTCNDFRSRDSFWPYCRNMVDFFESGEIPFQDMTNQNALVSSSGNNGNRCLAKPGDTYLVQLRSGGTHTLNLSGASGNFRVRWFDPRNGGAWILGDTISGGGSRSLGVPPDSVSEDWIALVQTTSGGTPANQAPVVSAGSDKSATLSGASVGVTLGGTASDDGLPQGSTLSRTWTRVSGPAAVTFSDAGSASTTATFTTAGSYTLRLSASDGSLTTADDVAVTITTSQPINQAPVVSAGPDASAVLSGSSIQVNLRGSASDDGLPQGSSLSLAWTMSSGPAAVSFSNASAAATSASFTAAGSYLLRLTVTDGQASASDEVLLTISPAAGGGSQTSFTATQDAYTENGKNYNTSLLRLGNTIRERLAYLQFDLQSASAATSATLRLTEDDDISSGSMTLRVYAAASNNWSESTVTSANAPAKGAQLASFTGDITAGKVLSFDVSAFVKGAGIYSFIIEADSTTKDVSLASSEHATPALRPSLSITTSGGGTPPANAAPVVNAGADKSSSYQNQPVDVPLSGSSSDDGLPQGASLAIAWSRVSGPAAVSFSPSNAAATNATFNAAGTYVLRLTASDGQLSASDDVTVTVVADIIDNEIPSVSAGPDASATLSGASVQVALNGSASDDGQPAGSTLTTSWTRTSGPAAVSFANAASATTTATFTTAGTYVLRLTASDGELSELDEVSITISPASAIGGTPVTFAAAQDAYTENGKNNNGSVLRIESSTRKRIIYFQFDLRSLSSAASAATLRLTQNDDVSSGPMTLRLYAGSSNNWTEANITSANAPAKGAQIAVFTGDITKGKVISFDVTPATIGAAIQSFVLEADSSTLDVSFASAENSTVAARPVLTVTPGAASALPPGDDGSVPGGNGEAAASALADLKIEALPENLIQLKARGLPGALYRVERSTDMIEWITIGTVNAEEDGSILETDTEAPAGAAFYRVSSP